MAVSGPAGKKKAERSGHSFLSCSNCWRCLASRMDPGSGDAEVPDRPLEKDLDSGCTSVVSFALGTSWLAYGSLSEAANSACSTGCA